MATLTAAQLSRAQRITISDRSQTLAGALESNEAYDLYRFDFKRGSRSSPIQMSVVLRGLAVRTGINLLNSTGKRLKRSAYFGNDPSSQVINRSLVKGTYYLEIEKINGNTNYRLGTVAVPNPNYVPSPRPSAVPAKQLATARKIDLDRQVRQFKDSVDRGNPTDLYRFNLDRRNEVNFVLRDLSAQADLDLLDSKGGLIKHSGFTSSETSIQLISRELKKGTYYIQVKRRSGDTSYRLTAVGVVVSDSGSNSGGTGGTGGTGTGGTGTGGTGTGGTGNNSGGGSSQRTPTLVQNVNPGRGRADPTDLINANGILYFAANDGTDGVELWRSDGTAAGTRLVSNIRPGSTGSSPTLLTAVDQTVYFTADDGTRGRELWRSDGTAAGTQIVSDILPGSTSSTPLDLVNVNGTLYFTAIGSTSDRQLWSSNGTAAGTTQVTAIGTGLQSFNPSGLVNFNGVLYFTANDSTNGRELWSSNGTAAGTTLVSNIAPGSINSDPSNLVAFNDSLYFSADDGSGQGQELWKSNGTAAGTTLVKDIEPGAGSSSPNNFAVVGNALYFGATTAANGTELWKSDGSAAGTALVKDIVPGTISSAPQDLVNGNGTLYFTILDTTATTGSSTRQLWRSDGTAAGTTQYAVSSSLGVGPRSLVPIATTLFFSDFTSATEREVFRVTIP